MIPRRPVPKPSCWRCEDWTTVLTPDRKSTIPCPECQTPKTTSRTPRAHR